MQTYFLTLLICIIAVLSFDAIGSVLSRKMNFNYAWLTPISLILYIATGFYGTLLINQMAGITMTGLLGLVDTILGYEIATRLKANFGVFQEELDAEDLRSPSYVLGMITFSLFMGWIGSLFA